MKKHLLLLLLLGIFVLTGSGSFGQVLNCQASFTYVADSSGGVQFTNTSTGNFSNAQWTFGDGTASTQFSPYHQYNALSWYYVCLTVWDSAGCQSTTCDTVFSGSASGGCQASFTPVVNGNVVQISNSSFGNYVGYSINYGDGTSGQTWSHVYAAPGVYNICLTIGNNPASPCTDTFCATVIVQGAPNCNAQFNASDTAGGTLFIPNVVQAGWNYYWTFGDGSTSTNPIPFHNYNANGVYLACLTVTDSAQNCSVTWCDSVQVGITTINCQANFGYQQSNGTAYFYGYNSGGSTFTNWTWTFGDGSVGTGQNPNHSYAVSGTYQVCLIASNFLCSDTICQNISVSVPAGNNCNAQFAFGDSAGVYYFFPLANSSFYNYYWSFGDNTSSTLTSPSHVYNGTGPYIVCLTVTDSSQGCTATWCDTIYINSVPPVPCQAYFSYTTDSLGNVQFYNASTGFFSNYQWSFGDGTGSQQFNPTHAYNGTGPYVVCLTVFGNSPANSCQSTFCDTIWPGQNANSCVPVFYTYPDSTVFGNGSMAFNLMNTCANTTYTWDFGDGSTATGPSHNHVYNATGWYNVCVTAVTPTNTYTFCNQVYAFRLSTGLASVEVLDATIYPNPAGETATLRFHAAGETLLEIFSLDGRLAGTQRAGILTGEVQLPLNTAALENGIYFIRMQSGTKQGTVKILVSH